MEVRGQGHLRIDRRQVGLEVNDPTELKPVSVSLPPHFAAAMATAGELGFSVLLILGPGSRAAAIGLFFINAVAVIPILT